MSLDKKIQETFNPPPSLEGEDWLMPSDEVFDAIEGVVYADDKSSKRRFPFWLWLLPLLLISSLAFIFFNNDSGVEFAEIQNNELKDVNEINSVDQPKSITTVPEDIDQEPSSKTKSSYLVADIVNQRGQTRNTGTKFSLGSTVVPLVNFTERFSSNIHTAENHINIDHEEVTINNNTIAVSDLNQVTSRVGYDKLLLLQNLALLPIRSQLELPIQNLIDVENQVGMNNHWSYKFSSGISLWNFNLSNNYLVALQPADFSHSDGLGYFVELGIERTVTQRFSIGLLASVDRNEFDSGHNSVINYDLSTEQDNKTKGFDLTMASPLGFLESNIVVARSVDASNNTNLVIDLDNRHRVTNFDLGLYTDIRLLEYGGLGLSTQMGVGLNYLSHVSNSLNRFSTSEAGFDSHSSTIVSDQSDLKRVRTYLGLGLNLEYDFSSVTNVGLQYQLRRDMNSIYQSGDFSTIVQRQLAGLYIKRRI